MAAAVGKKAETALMQLTPKMCEMMAFATELSKSGIVPAAYAARPSAIFACLQYGKEFGIPPMSALQNIAVINGKPTLGTDLMVALAMRHPEWGGYEITKSDDKIATVKVYRVSTKLNGKILEYTSTFSVEDAQKAGLLRPNSPWDKWRKRMLKHRAMAFAIRDAFPDVLAGSYSYEEMDPDAGAAEEEMMVNADDIVHAAILDDQGVPVEIRTSETKPKAKPKVAPVRAVPAGKKV